MKKVITILSDSELASKVDRIVNIRPMANEYRQLCNEVKADLQARNLTAFTTPAGHSASINRHPGITWIVTALHKALTKSVFELLCPRRPDIRKLNQRLAATPEDKALAKCRVDTPGKLELEVLAKGETAVVSNVSDADDVEEAA